jgi:hypothetical protein
VHNRIAHGYLLVEPANVRSTVDRDLPVMVEAVRAAIDRLPDAQRTAGPTSPRRPQELAAKFGFGVESVTMRRMPT